MKRAIFILLGIIVLFGAVFLWYVSNNQEKLLGRMVTRQIQASADVATELMGNKEGITVMTIGTSTPIPSDRSQTSTAIFVNGHFFIFDVGYGSLERMERFNLPLPQLEAVFITHYHTDHYIDLPYLINRSWQLGRNTDLNVYGPTGLDTVMKSIDGFLSIENQHRVDHHGSEIMNVKYASGISNEFSVAKNGEKVVYDEDGVKITAFDVGHEPVSPDLGYKIEYNGKKVVLSGDTNKNKNVEKQSKDADLLVHEAMLKDVMLQISGIQEEIGNQRNAEILHDVVEYHTSPTEIAEIAAAANVKKVVMNHLGPVPSNPFVKRRYTQGLNKIYDGEIVVANDGDVFVVK